MMKTSVIEVRDMLSVLSVQGVEDRIGEVPGVESVTVNHSAGNATVRYDETRLDIADIRSDVRQSAHQSESAADRHPGHSALDAPRSSPAAGSPKSTLEAARPAGVSQKAAADVGATAAPKADLASKPPAPAPDEKNEKQEKSARDKR